MSAYKEIIPYYYQTEAVDKLFEFIIYYDGHPLVVLPTGSGKTVVLCEFINKYITEFPKDEILILSHTKRILEQDYSALCDYFGDRAVGLYSAGLKSREKKKVTVAGIQSVYKRATMFENVGIIIIDEAHLVTIEETGMYRKLFAEMEEQFGEVVYIGLTATHFRTGHGYIHKGEDALFTEVIVNYCEFEKYNKLVAEGYVGKLISKKTSLEMDPTGVPTLGGDYKLKQLSIKFDRQSITNKAVEETIQFGKNYKKWLLFAIDIEHCDNIKNALRARGIDARAVHSRMDSVQVDKNVADFKAGKYKAIVNVDMLTVGFDDPEIDLIAVLVCTKAPVKHIQLMGRGGRVSPTKTHCLILDFGGNCDRLGPINDVVLPAKKGEKGEGTAPIRTCPECNAHNHISLKVCDVCGFVFVVVEKISPTASMGSVIKSSLIQWVDVREVHYSIHAKPGKPSSMRVTYSIGPFIKFSEWVTYDHKGWGAKSRANHWVKARLCVSMSMPKDLSELLSIAHTLKKPKSILVDNSSKFADIKSFRF